MTTPESSPDKVARVRRPDVVRHGPDRSGGAAKPVPRPPAPSVGEPINEAVASAVRMGYDVVAENIKQGRLAAARFRQGEYSIRDVPGDVESLAKRMIDLARELSTTTFDVAERLLRDPGPGDPTAKASPFYPTPDPNARKSPPPTPDSPLMTVKCQFVGTPRAVLRSAMFARPRLPIFADAHIASEPLKSTIGARAITDVTFSTDPQTGVLVVSVGLSPDQAAGVYAGLVTVAHQDWPMGVLAIEVLA